MNCWLKNPNRARDSRHVWVAFDNAAKLKKLLLHRSIASISVEATGITRSLRVNTKNIDYLKNEQILAVVARFAFHPDGRPRKALRRALFHTNGRVRKIFRSIVFDRNECPRRIFYPYVAIITNFDENWYVSNYSIFYDSRLSPLHHYLTVGKYVGFKPNNNDLPSHGMLYLGYGDWANAFDTPDTDAIRQFQMTANAIGPVMVVVEFDVLDDATIRNVQHSLRSLVGVNWRAKLNIKNAKLLTISAMSRSKLLGDSRITLYNENDESNENIVVYFNAGAILRSHGVRLLIDALVRNPKAVLAYGDEDHIDKTGDIHNHWFKPAFSPLLAKSGVLLGRVVALNASRLGGSESLIKQFFDERVDNRQLLIDISLKEDNKAIINVSHVIFHNTTIVKRPINAITPQLPTTVPVVSIIIPTRNMWHLLSQCLDSIYDTDWPQDKLEIIVVDNGSTEDSCINGMIEASKSHKIVIIRDDGDFNFSRLNNDAIRGSRGELIVLLNNDTKAITKSWLKELAAYALVPGAGAVGPKLLYEDNTVQHAGVILGMQGGAAHCHRGVGANDGGYRELANITHEVLAVTGACLAVTKHAYNDVGGLNEAFPVAFNDIVFCMDLYAKGYTNYYVAKPLFFHYESKSRGFDDTKSKAERARIECMRAWRLHKELLNNDPYYSPCLSLERDYTLSFAPRRQPAWRRHFKNNPVHIFILSCVHKQGHGVPVVIQQHARGLIAQGFRVTIGGPKSNNDLDYPGCERVDVLDPRMAFRWAIKNSVDVIIAQTSPFFSVARWAGDALPVIAYDYGEPPPGRFEDWAERLNVLKEKDLNLLMCSKVFTISQAITDESRTPVDGIIPLGNTHLGRWDRSKIEIREGVRHINGWHNAFVVLNVCRFHEAERNYKGVDTYIEVAQRLKDVATKLSRKPVFVLCGKGDEADIKYLRKCGIDVRANVSDDELVDYYAAADAYLNFSTWEGYNLGIGQALAMGLPVVASDIPAHRAFGVTIAADSRDAVFSLMEIMSQPIGPRVPTLWDWDYSIAALTAAINDSKDRHLKMQESSATQ